MFTFESIINSIEKIDTKVNSIQELVTYLERVYFYEQYQFQDSSNIFLDIAERLRSCVNSYSDILLYLNNHEVFDDLVEKNEYKILKLKIKIKSQIEIVETYIQYLEELLK